jgi:hypothetical protein
MAPVSEVKDAASVEKVYGNLDYLKIILTMVKTYRKLHGKDFGQYQKSKLVIQGLSRNLLTQRTEL